MHNLHYAMRILCVLGQLGVQAESVEKYNAEIMTLHQTGAKY